MKRQRNFKFSQITNDRIDAIVEMLPAESDTHAIEEAIAHFEQWLKDRQPQQCEVCGTKLDKIEMPVRWMYRCDCD